MNAYSIYSSFFISSKLRYSNCAFLLSSTKAILTIANAYNLYVSWTWKLLYEKAVEQSLSIL